MSEDAFSARDRGADLANAILHSALDAIVIFDHDSRILEFNPAAEAMFGRSRAEAIGRDACVLLLPSATRELIAAEHGQTGSAWDAIRHGGRADLIAVTADGGQRHVAFSVSPLHRSDPPTYIAFLRDITHRARASDELRANASRLQAIIHAQQALTTTSPSVSALLARSGELVRKAMEADGVTVELLEGEHLVIRSLAGTHTPEKVRPVDFNVGLSGRAFRENRTLWCPDTDLDPDVDRGAARALGVRSAIVTVIGDSDDQPCGLIKISSRTPGHFSQADAHALELFTGAFGAELQRRRDEAKRLRLRVAQDTVLEIQKEITESGLGVQGLMELTCLRAGRLLGASTTFIETIDGAQMVCVAASGLKSGHVGMRVDLSGSLSGRCVGENRVLVCADTETDPRVAREVCRSVGARSVLVVPLRAQDEVIGALMAISEAPDMFSVADGNHLQILVETLGSVIQRQRAQSALEHTVTHDLVTGLQRHGVLESRLADSMAAHADPCALLFVDLDQFNAVNESMGHVAADRVLRIVAERLLLKASADIAVSHFAGDEFLLSVSGRDEEAVIALADDIREAIAQPIDIEALQVKLTATVGISFHPRHATTPIDLLRRAQIAKERGKSHGRNRSCVFVAEYMERIEDRMRLGGRLRGATARGDLLLHYQPQFRGRDRRFHGFEALLRWHDEVLGTVSPARFIPVAEALGLMPDIGDWVIDEACRQSRAWLDAGAHGFCISINVSAQQLQRPGLYERVAVALDEYRLPVGMVDIELTESSMMENVVEIQDTLSRLRGIGVQISLDDFGTGYSSLAYLKHFPPDKLKIDQSFVRGLPDSPDDAAIARTIVSIAHQLGMQVSAEGVETEAQACLLLDMGCDELQGYLLGRPEPAADAQRHLLPASRADACASRSTSGALGR